MPYTQIFTAKFGHTVIWVICDILSKFVHFMTLPTKFAAQYLAMHFLVEICRLHGIPRSIVSDREPIFLSDFWKELFRVQGTTLKYTIAYRPESDDQIEVVNRSLETYICCFTCKNHRQWFKFLHLDEYWHNSTFHSSIKITLFEVCMVENLLLKKTTSKVSPLYLHLTSHCKTSRRSLIG